MARAGSSGDCTRTRISVSNACEALALAVKIEPPITETADQSNRCWGRVRHFQKIAEGIDVIPLLNALAVRQDLWNENTLRTTFPGSPHAAVDDVWCMFDDPDGDVVNSIQTHPYRAWYELPIKDMVLNLMRRVGGTQLGRVIITRLPPGASIPEHVDQGAPAEFFSRYHIVLQSLPGCITRSGNEVITMQMGEAWLFDNRSPHSVTNNSADDRVVIIADIRVA